MIIVLKVPQNLLFTIIFNKNAIYSFIFTKKILKIIKKFSSNANMIS